MGENGPTIHPLAFSSKSPATKKNWETYGPEEGIPDRNGVGNGEGNAARGGEVRGLWLGEASEGSPPKGDVGNQESTISAR